jgi:hypothetical protein
VAVRVASFILVLSLMLIGCQESGPGPKHEGPVHGFLDVPVEQLHEQTEKYLGAVFEGRFMLAEPGAEPVAPGQPKESGLVLLARPEAQSARVLRLRVPSRLERQARDRMVGKAPVKARMRFTGIGSGGQPVFELMAVLE